MIQVFHNDPQKEEQLSKNGFVLIDLCPEADILNFREDILTQVGDIPAHFFASSHHPDFQLRKLVSDRIVNFINKSLPTSLSGMQLLGAALISKCPGKTGVLPAHRDWNIVDESRSRSFNVWVPLSSMSEQSGTIRLLAGSHLDGFSIRGPGVNPDFDASSRRITEKLQPLSINLGQALIYDHRLIHDSGENLSEENRLAMVAGFVKNNTQMVHYFGEEMAGELEITEYQSGPDFFMTENIFERPKGLAEKTRFKFDPKAPSRLPEIEAKDNENGPKSNTLFSRIFKTFFQN